MSNPTLIVCICGESVPITEAEKVWLDTGQGMACVRSHPAPGCIERTVADMGERYDGAKRIEEPKSKAERELAQRQAASLKAEYEELADKLL